MPIKIAFSLNQGSTLLIFREAQPAKDSTQASIVVLAERYAVWDVLTLDNCHFHALRGPGRRRFRLLPSA